MRAALTFTALTCLFNGAFVAWSVTDLRADIRAGEIRAIGDGNLERAERRMVACIESRPFTIGTAIYVPQTRKSALTTAQVPEVGGKL